jgi:hypothetical protein
MTPAPNFCVADMRSGMEILETKAAMAFRKNGIDADPMTPGQPGMVLRAMNEPDAHMAGNAVVRTLQCLGTGM